MVGPPPKHISNGKETITFDECAFGMDGSEIAKIYLTVMFGKKHTEYCKNRSRQDVARYTSGGKKFIKVNIPSIQEHPILPKGFNTEHEEYELKVQDNGEVNIKAKFYPGVVRALDTLSQLVKKDESKRGIYMIEYAPIEVKDKPRYPYRGVMLDTAREFFFPDTIKQVIDGMMLGKLNILHWHFSDDESFPMYSETFPDLTDYTAFSKEEVYKPYMVKEIVEYGKIRGVKVVPELEGPGHMNALGSYPKLKDLIACYGDPSVVDNHANGGPPSAPINPVNEGTYKFLKSIMKDMAKNFDTDIWHLGGDEVGRDCWKSIHEVQEYMSKHNKSITDLHEHYMQKERKLLSEVNSEARAMYWYQNDRFHYHKDDILQLWSNVNKLQTQMNEHGDNYFVLSPSDRYYLN